MKDTIIPTQLGLLFFAVIITSLVQYVTKFEPRAELRSQAAFARWHIENYIYGSQAEVSTNDSRDSR